MVDDLVEFEILCMNAMNNRKRWRSLGQQLKWIQAAVCKLVEQSLCDDKRAHMHNLRTLVIGLVLPVMMCVYICVALHNKFQCATQWRTNRIDYVCVRPHMCCCPWNWVSPLRLFYSIASFFFSFFLLNIFNSLPFVPYFFIIIHCYQLTNALQ